MMQRFVVVTALAVVGVGAFVAPAQAAGTVQTVRSTHLAGYARTHAAGSTASENVDAVFTVPRVRCASVPASGGTVAIWAGVDGFAAGSTAQLRAGVQIVCDSNTAAPRYQVFWAQAPGAARVLGRTAPGHEIYIFVSSDPGQPVNVSDNTTGNLYAGSTFRYRTDHSGVECFVDASSGAGATVPQPDFGTIAFTACDDFDPGVYRPVADPSTALPGETTYRVQNSTGGVRARTSAPNARGGWNVAWVAAGS